MLHREKGNIVFLFYRMDRDDIGVIEGRHRLGLTTESFEPLGVGSDLRRQHLDRHLAIEPGVAGQPHLTHSTLAELFEDLVVKQRAADHLGPQSG